MLLKEITIDDIESQKEILFLAMWKPENENPYGFEVMEEPYAKAYYDRWTEKENDIGFFAMDGDKVVGIAQIRKKRSATLSFSDIPELVIAVKPEYQGKGIATLLMKEIIKKNPARGIRLNVHPKNTKAIRLYLKLGFETYFEDEKGWKAMILIHKKDTFFI